MGLRRLWAMGWFGLGYMLSPLSWWNDLFFNLPIALALGSLLAFFVPDWFVPGTIVGYWLSNVVGIVMMQMGVVDFFQAEEKRNWKRDLLLGFAGSTLYTIVILVLISGKVLALPEIFSRL
ncbi:MAG: hypothetical protein ACO3EZ_17120 [Prochlorotrichaceae cyanobacterium]